MNRLSQSSPMGTKGVILVLLLSLLIGSPAPIEAQTGCATTKFALANGSPSWLEDCGQVDLQGSPEQIARRALQAQNSTLGLSSADNTFALLKVNTSPLATHVRFVQKYKGVPVYLGQVLVQYGKDGTVQLINNQALPNLALDVNPTIDATTAQAIAHNQVPGANRLRTFINQDLVIYASGKSPELAWHLVFYTQNPPGDWHAMISAHTGAVLGLWDEIWNAGGSGQGFVPNPVQQSGDTSLRDNNDATSAALDDARVALTLQNLNAATDQLKGSYVDLTGTDVQGCDLPYTPGLANEPSRIYNYTRDDDRFEEVTVYSAVDGVQSWFQALGFTNVNNRSIPIDVHCISADNSYYSDSDAALHFGDGGVDDAEDSDIVVHEYGHSVQANQVAGWGPGSNTEQRAMGEGFGDFLSGIYYINTGNSTYQDTYKYCIGEWDATGYNPVVGGNSGSGCLRWIDGRNEETGTDIGTYSGTPTEEHDDGRYWAAALTCMYEGLGANTTARDTIMKLVLQHHFSLLPDNSTQAFEKAIQALRLADLNLLSGANQQLIINCAIARNLIQAPTLFSPTITSPTQGTEITTDQSTLINWSTIGDTTSTTYRIEYAFCNRTSTFSDTVENGVGGWTVSHVDGTQDWAQATDQAYSPTHSWFASDTDVPNDQYLLSPAIPIVTSQELRFWHRYDTELEFDGGVVEISTNNGGSWTDLGPQMFSNGYNITINDTAASPLAGRQAFSGDSKGWIETQVDLSSFVGQTIKLRFRQADDDDIGASGWWIDDIELRNSLTWTALATTAAGATSINWTPPTTLGTYCLRMRAQAQGYLTSAYSPIRSVVVTAPNTAPTITALVDQTVPRGALIPTTNITIADLETAPGNLIVTGISSNQTLLPNSGIVIGGNGANRTITLTPTASEFGTTIITISVSDGQASTNASYRLIVHSSTIYLPLIQRN